MLGRLPEGVEFACYLLGLLIWVLVVRDLLDRPSPSWAAFSAATISVIVAVLIPDRFDSKYTGWSWGPVVIVVISLVAMLFRWKRRTHQPRWMLIVQEQEEGEYFAAVLDERGCIVARSVEALPEAEAQRALQEYQDRMQWAQRTDSVPDGARSRRRPRIAIHNSAR